MATEVIRYLLLGGFFNHPSEKYARQIGSFPQVGMNIKNVWNHQPAFLRLLQDEGKV